MGELPPFIVGVPEESLDKPRLQRVPARIQIKRGALKITSGNTTFFVIPEGYFFELVYYNFECVNDIAAGTLNIFSFQVLEAPGATPKIIKQITMDGLGNFSEAVSLKNPIFFETGESLQQHLEVASLGTSLVETNFVGNLIPNKDRNLL